MLENSTLVDSSDCIVMKPTERFDIHNRMIYSGDIVRIIDPGNSYLLENYSGIGFIIFDTNKGQFVWHGMDYGGFPQYNMSGKAFEILGNVFEDKRFLYEHKKSDGIFFSLYKLTNKNGQEFMQKFFENNPNMCKREILIEKVISEESIKIKEEEKKHWRLIEADELKRTFRSKAEAKRKERYMKIYEQIKEELNEGKACG
ncbi:MAG: YopX family protein [bacterium]|nr:YopX family protein [bacterium]